MQPFEEVGVMRYCTDPAALLLGLVSAWLMIEPPPPLAPVMLPETVPIVQLKVEDTVEVKLIFGPPPLQVLAVLPFVTAGFGFTVTIME
jgi:hypothetical protein